MDMFKKLGSLLTIAAALSIGGLTMTGCEEQGPAENAGEQIDDAQRNLGDAMEDAGQKAEEAAEEAEQNLEDAADNMGN